MAPRNNSARSDLGIHNYLDLRDCVGIGDLLGTGGSPDPGEAEVWGSTDNKSDPTFPFDAASLFGTSNSGSDADKNSTKLDCGSFLNPFDVNPDSGEYDVLKELPYAMLVIILYIIVIFLGAVGNALVVMTVVRTRKLWNATNIFIANLAFADVFVCVFDLPVSAYYQITDDWIFGEALCRVIPVCFAVVVYASTLTLTMISVDRYLLIVLPFRRRMPVSVAVVMVVCIAAMAIAVASPIALYSKYVVIDDPLLGLHRRYCTEDWPHPQVRFLYTIITLVLQYFLPLIIIAILYSLIFQRLRSRVKPKHSRKTKTTKMLVAVVSVFAITWTPFHLYAVITEVHYDAVKGKYYKFLDALLRLFAMLSSCLNPFLYGWFNENYRNAFLSLVHRSPAGVHAVHREDSDETTRRSGVHTSPPKRGRRVLLSNGKCKLTARVETLALKQIGQADGLEVHNNNITNTGRSPLLPKHETV